MKFRDLTINQTFTIAEYPDCVGIKVREFAGSCCSPPHNAKMVCDVDGVPQEKIVKLDLDTEVTPQKKAVQPNLLKNPTVLKKQLNETVPPPEVIPATKTKPARVIKIKQDESSLPDRRNKKIKKLTKPAHRIKKKSGGNFGE